MGGRERAIVQSTHLTPKELHVRQATAFDDLTYRLTACGFAFLLLWSMVDF